MKTLETAKLAEFLSRPRTIAEIAKEFSLSGLDEAAMRSLRLPSAYDLFEQKAPNNLPIFMAAKRQPKESIKPRNWAYWVDNKNDDPYIWIQFPLDLSLSRLKIVGLSDIHYGAKAHSRRRFGEYLRWIESQDDVYTFLNGDVIENAILDAVGGAAYESALTPTEQIWGTKDGREPGMIKLLRPIAHKILWAQPGNHEWRTWKKCGIDPLRIICSELDIPYFEEPIYADILAWRQRFTFYCHHGTTGSGTKGGKLNAASRPGEFQEAINFIIMGHVHDSAANSVTRIVRHREFDETGKLVSFRLRETAQHVVICPSFYGYFGSYGSRAGYAPGSWGAVSCTLYRDGNYRVAE